MPTLPKKSLAIFSLTSCEGCQFELISFYDHLTELLNYYDLKEFRLGQEAKLPGLFDVALIEGSPENEEQFNLLKIIRKESKIVVTMGSCAHMGGIQSERNRMPDKIFHKDRKVKTVSDIIKVDYVVPGCPVSHSELVKCLMDIYWDKQFNLPDLAVCFECRQHESECLLKHGKPCLGPITRAGCKAICPEKGEACLGCRGPLDQANFKKMRQMLSPIIEKKEIGNWLTIYGDYEEIHKKIMENNA